MLGKGLKKKAGVRNRMGMIVPIVFPIAFMIAPCWWIYQIYPDGTSMMLRFIQLAMAQQA